MRQSEKSLLQGEVGEPIGCERMYGILKGEFKERPEEAVMRLMAQLGGIKQVIYKEPGEGVRGPGGARGRLSEKKGRLTKFRKAVGQ